MSLRRVPALRLASWGHAATRPSSASWRLRTRPTWGTEPVGPSASSRRPAWRCSASGGADEGGGPSEGGAGAAAGAGERAPGGAGGAPPPAPVHRPSHVARMLALAHHLQCAIARGLVPDRAEVARRPPTSRLTPLPAQCRSAGAGLCLSALGWTRHPSKPRQAHL
jgi:hypothetical protein